MDIIIFSGQSNMQGQTEGLPENNPVIECAFEYRNLTDSLIPLCHPVGEDIVSDGIKMMCGAYEGGGTLVPAFCRAYIKETGRKVVAVHTALGATTIAEWQHGTRRYWIMARKIRAAIAKAEQIEPIGKIFFVWLQGESDSLMPTGEEEYFEKLITHKKWLKADFGIEKFGIIKVGYFASVSNDWHVSGYTDEEKLGFDEGIMRAQERAVETDKDFVMLTRICTEMSKDATCLNPKAKGHYNNASMDIIGREAGTTLAEYVK